MLYILEKISLLNGKISLPNALKIVQKSIFEVFWCQNADFAMRFAETVWRDPGRDSRSDKSTAGIQSGILVRHYFFCDANLSTLLPPRFVGFNSKTQKTRMLFGRVAISQGGSGGENFVWNRKNIDIPKTCRQLFSIRTLIWEYQLVVGFYSFFAI